MKSFESPENKSVEMFKTEQARDFLLEIIEEKNTSHFNLSPELAIKREKEVDVITEYDKALRRLLSSWGIEGVAIKKAAPGIYKIPLTERSSGEFDADLPQEYGYKGGKARALLLRELGIDPQATARDIDLIRVTKEEKEGLDIALAKKYSSEDLENNYGVEPIKKDYFDTRDFTMNEVIAADGALFLTKQCLLDTARRIVRFSDFEKRELWHPEERGIENGYFVNDKLMAKAVRFAASEMVRGKKLELADKEVYSYLEINNFHIALHLDRALHEGKEVAERYIEELVRLGQLPGDIGSPEDFICGFVKQTEEDGCFFFRYAPRDDMNAEEWEIHKIEKEIMKDEALRETDWGKKLLAEIRYGDFASDK